MKKKETPKAEVVQEVINSGDRVKLLRNLVTITFDKDTIKGEERSKIDPKDSVAIIDIKSTEDTHTINLTFEDKNTVTLYLQDLKYLNRIVKLAEGESQ